MSKKHVIFAFRAWLILLNLIYSSLHFPANTVISFFFIAEQYFIQPLVFGLAIVQYCHKPVYLYGMLTYFPLDIWQEWYSWIIWELYF
jgi:hypothetical protein